MTNTELDQAIRTFYELIRQTEDNHPLYEELREHWIELLAAQLLRVNADC